MPRWPFGKRTAPGRAGLTAGTELFRAGRYAEAADAFRTAIAELQRQLQADPGSAEINGNIAGALNNLGLCRTELGQPVEAAQILSGAAVIYGNLADADPADRARYARLRVDSLRAMVTALAAAEAWPQAMEYSGVALTEAREVPLPDHGLARTLRLYADIRAATGQEVDEALKAVNEAMTLHMAILSREPVDVDVEAVYATELVLAKVLRRKGETRKADGVEAGVRGRHLDGLLTMLRSQRR